jgi:hypothetical protein
MHNYRQRRPCRLTSRQCGCASHYKRNVSSLHMSQHRQAHNSYTTGTPLRNIRARAQLRAYQQTQRSTKPSTLYDTIPALTSASWSLRNSKNHTSKCLSLNAWTVHSPSIMSKHRSAWSVSVGAALSGVCVAQSCRSTKGISKYTSSSWRSVGDSTFSPRQVGS